MTTTQLFDYYLGYLKDRGNASLPTRSPTRRSSSQSSGV